MSCMYTKNGYFLVQYEFSSKERHPTKKNMYTIIKLVRHGSVRAVRVRRESEGVRHGSIGSASGY